MNILTIVVLIIIVLYALRGYRQGLIKSIASSISLLVSLMLVSFISPYVSDFIETQTPVYSMITKQCQSTFTLSVNETGIVGNGKNGVSIASLQDEMIDQLQIPEILKKSLKSHNTADTYQKLAVNNFNEYVPKFLSDLIIRAISFVISWLIIFIFLQVVVMTMDVITSLPIIHGVNQYLGMALGILQGLIIVWIGFIAITMLGNTSVGKSLLAMISESKILTGLYDTNLLLRVVQTFAKNLF